MPGSPPLLRFASISAKQPADRKRPCPGRGSRLSLRNGERITPHAGRKTLIPACGRRVRVRPSPAMGGMRDAGGDGGAVWESSSNPIEEAEQAEYALGGRRKRF